MANEIKATAQLQCTNGNFTLPKYGSSNVGITQANPGGVLHTLSASTSDAALTLTEISTFGWALLINIDTNPANYVDFGPDNGSGAIAKAIRLVPGEPAQLVRLVPGTTYRHKAAAGTPKWNLIILEN